MTSIRSLTKLALCAVFAFGFLSVSQAADATGTWSWTRPGRNGGPEQKMTLTLKADGEKVTGKVTSPGRQGGTPVETEIKDGKIKGDEISFTVTREYNGNTMTQKYNGKVTADAIKGKIESTRDGQAQSRDWEAKKVTDKK
jgi:hypothetical protein